MFVKIDLIISVMSSQSLLIWEVELTNYKQNINPYRKNHPVTVTITLFSFFVAPLGAF